MPDDARTPEVASAEATAFVMPQATPGGAIAAYPAGRGNAAAAMEGPPGDAGAPTLAPMPAEIAGAVIKVCREVRALRMDGSNTHDNYRFTSIDVFLETVGAWCAEAGLIIVVDEVGTATRPVDKYKAGQWAGQDYVLYASYRFWLVHESGAIWQHPMTRRVALRAGGPQAYGSAESYAMKRFMRALFKVPSGDATDPVSDAYDPDSMPDRAPGAPAPQRAASDLFGAPAPAAPASPAQAQPVAPANGWDAPPGQPPGDGEAADPLFGPRAPPTPPRVTGRIAPPRGGQPPIAGEVGHRPAALPPPPGELTGGQTPFRVLDANGRTVAEYRDLKGWGDGLKRLIAREPDAFAANVPEIDRLEAFFLSDPSLTAKKRAGTEHAFALLRALAPRPFTPPDQADGQGDGQGVPEQHPMAEQREPGQEG